MQYGRYSDDFGEDGPSRDFDESDRDVDTDLEMESETAEGGGYGRDRDDVRYGGGLMAMSRRDSVRDPVREARDLRRSSIADMKSFLGERDSGVIDDPMQSVSDVALTGLTIFAGAAAAGFLAQRFRQEGALVPIGVTLGVLGLAAAQFGMAGKFSPTLRNVSFGAAASAVALWAAGRGIISSEAAALNAPATAPTPSVGTGVPVTAGVPQQQPPQYAPQYVQQPYVPQYAPNPTRAFPMPRVAQPPYVRPQAPQMVAISMADFQNLVGRRAAA